MAGEIFHITHEPGDLSEYTSTVTGGGDLSVTGGAALVGSFGLSVLIDDTGDIYGQVDFTQLTSTAYGLRIYIDPNVLTMAGSDAFDVALVLRSVSDRARIRLRFSGGNYTVSWRVIDDSLGTQATAFYTITDDVHYIEGRVEYASSAVANDAQITLLIDGVQKEQKTGLDIYDVSKPDNVRFGAPGGLDAGTSGTLYLDDFVLRDDATEIGAAPSGISPWYAYAQQ
ncbi:hypothetical protein LCGC14_1614290 [marine sediment metagenome]|uniref:LamG-like jellyroll fold domain-containing protein n=1 Tax=marine sediment metagenome TaxID=412755 RepID=A0A0F9I7F3_9ZZZZ